MSKIISLDSFHNIKNWYKEAKANVLDETIFVLVGTKNDLINERVVTFEQGTNLVNDLKLDLFFETSSKSGDCVEEMFTKSAEEILEHNFNMKELKDQVLQNTRFKQIVSNDKEKKKGCC